MSIYYASPTGSDANDGSAPDAAHAFRTCAKFLTVAATGDNLRLVAGSYPEILAFGAGESGKSLKFERYGAGTVTIDPVVTTQSPVTFASLADGTAFEFRDLQFPPTSVAGHMGYNFNLATTAQCRLILVRCRVVRPAGELERASVLATGQTTSAKRRSLFCYDCDFVQNSTVAHEDGTILQLYDLDEVVIRGGSIVNANQHAIGVDIFLAPQHQDCQRIEISGLNWITAAKDHQITLYGFATNWVPDYRYREIAIHDNVVDGRGPLLVANAGIGNSVGGDRIRICRNRYIGATKNFVFCESPFFKHVSVRDNTFQTTGALGTGNLITIGKYQKADELCTVDVRGNDLTCTPGTLGGIYLGRAVKGGTLAYNRIRNAGNVGITLRGSEGVAVHDNDVEGCGGILLGPGTRYPEIRQNTIVSRRRVGTGSGGAVIQIDRYDAADRTGVLSTRTSDTAGIITVDPSSLANFDARASDRLHIYLEDEESNPYWRYDVLVTAISATTITFEGGTGDVLPLAGSYANWHLVSPIVQPRINRNILVAVGAGGYGFYDGSETLGRADWVHGGLALGENVYYPIDGAKLARLRGVDYAAGNLTGFRAALDALADDPDGTLAVSPNDAGSSEADPGLIDLTGADFHLRTGALAGAATPVQPFDRVLGAYPRKRGARRVRIEL